MGQVGALTRREMRDLCKVSAEVSEVDSGLEALCELLSHANGASVQAGGIHALLRPLQRRLSAAAGDLVDLDR